MGNYKKDYLSIKEFAEFVGMTVETLRHYDKKGIFRPAKIGIEHDNHYRYYTATQITTIKMIKVLAEIGVPLCTIKELAEDRTPEKLMKLMSKYQEIVGDELRFLNEVHNVISAFLELLIIGISAIEDEIKVSELPEKHIILGEENNYGDEDSLYQVGTRCAGYPIVNSLEDIILQPLLS